MFSFSAKSKSFFVDLGDSALLLARTSAAAPPFIVEDIQECSSDDLAALAEALKVLQPKKTSSYLQAVCGVYPPRRVVRRVTLDLKRVKEPGYFNEIASQQLRIDPDQHALVVLQAPDGNEFDADKATQKEVVVCGVPSEDVNSIQDKLLDSGLYPDRLELGTVSTIGALADYLAFTKSKTPTLVLEIAGDSTQSFIVSAAGLETTRAITQGLDGMIPLVQKELGLKDEESAQKLFYSNAFDFTGLGPMLIKRLLKELQSSIGFYEVQTGQSIGQVICPMLPPKLAWIEQAIADQLSVAVLKPDFSGWLQSRQITLAESVAAAAQDPRLLGLFGLMAQYPRHATVPDKAP
jgi:Tfp pilus assembly PilM family ATPase